MADELLAKISWMGERVVEIVRRTGGGSPRNDVDVRNPHSFRLRLRVQDAGDTVDEDLEESTPDRRQVNVSLGNLLKTTMSVTRE